MTILSNDSGKIIKISLNDNIDVITDYDEKRICYSIDLPKVTATSKEDAETIQKEVNTFVNKLCHKILNK